MEYKPVMKKSQKRQQNYRHRKDLEVCMRHFIYKIKSEDPSDLQLLQKRLEELFKCIEEYILLTNNKGENYESIFNQRQKKRRV